ncbi:Uncharacterised protein [Proteus mirabilis]|nr:Uncharacterised protein [Proteus mirabilis]
MPDFKERLKGLNLPSWMNKGEPAKLLNAVRKFGQVFMTGCYGHSNNWTQKPVQKNCYQCWPISAIFTVLKGSH